MLAEKKSSKGRGGFFHLFDWNGKSRKKLFSNELDLIEGTKQGKRSEENLPATRLLLIEEEEIGVPSAKGSSDFSCASVLTDDDDGTAIKPAGVVARLMGLDSLPVLCATESNSATFLETQSLQYAHSQKRTPDLQSEYQNASSKNQLSRVDGFSRKESRPQKLPSSPIERFQTETLPPKSAKSYPVTQHKLLSPIKNPGFISTKNATDIMEAAAKIIEPGLQVRAKGKLPSVGSASVPIKIRDLKENARASQRTSRLPEVPRRTESNAVKYLKGQSLNKSWNGPEDAPSFKVSPVMAEGRSVTARSKGKSVSLAIQAKANVQKREGLNSSSRGSLAVKEDNRQVSTQPFKSHQSIVKNNQNKSSGRQKNSSVLRQNNQKQNCPTNKNKLPSKPLVSNQQGRKFMTGDSSSGRSAFFNKVSGNYRDGNKKGGSTMTDLAKDAPSSRTKNFPGKKRALGESGSVDTVSVYEDEKKLVQPQVDISGHLNLVEDNSRNAMDVVSFTFTSPMVKPLPGSWSSSQMMEKRGPHTSHVDSSDGSNSPALRNERVPSPRLNAISGDALSILLEQKLRELASGVGPSFSTSTESSSGPASSTILQDVVSSLNALSIIPEKRDSPRGPKKDELGGGSNSGCFSTDGQVLKSNHESQGMEEMKDCSSSITSWKVLDCQYTSPVSILEASFSNESYNSSENLNPSNGSQTHSSNQSQETIGSNSSMRNLSVEAEELSDSASSVFTAIDQEHATVHIRTDEEMEYVKEVLSNAELMFKNLPLLCARGIINSHLFDRLEFQKTGSRNGGLNKSSRLRRKELFDCVCECVDLKCSPYIIKGYKAWSKGVMMVRKEGLSEEICKEILGWRNMQDQMVDELVEKDMSSHLGTWLDFETEVFVIGVEIERRILSSLIAELVADMFVQGAIF